MKVPAKVRIGSVDYLVDVKQGPLILNKEQCKGLIDYEYHQIEIDKSVHDVQGVEQTFLHEVVHGIIREYQIDIGDIDEETLVETIARGLHQVIRDNSAMFLKEPSNE